MTLEIGGQNQNQKKTTTTESRSDRGHGGDRRESRREVVVKMRMINSYL